MEVQTMTDEEKDKLISRYARMSFANLRQNILQDLVNNKMKVLFIADIQKSKWYLCLNRRKKMKMQFVNLAIIYT